MLLLREILLGMVAHGWADWFLGYLFATSGALGHWFLRVSLSHKCLLDNHWHHYLRSRSDGCSTCFSWARWVFTMKVPLCRPFWGFHNRASSRQVADWGLKGKISRAGLLSSCHSTLELKPEIDSDIFQQLLKPEICRFNRYIPKLWLDNKLYRFASRQGGAFKLKKPRNFLFLVLVGWGHNAFFQEEAVILVEFHVGFTLLSHSFLYMKHANKYTFIQQNSLMATWRYRSIRFVSTCLSFLMRLESCSSSLWEFNPFEIVTILPG